METEKILFVDDEQAVLDGLKRLLYKDFSIEIALGSRQGLATVEQKGPFAVVVSDMRMPEMDGAHFLANVRTISPETVRIALTGYADIETSIHAVNEGNIFRFLTKPCTKEVLAAALHAGIEQYRLVRSEKDLLEKTLRGSIKVLSEVISLVNPVVFSRATRVQRYVQHMVKRLALPSPWRFEVAAMLSQLGCVMLPQEITETYFGAQTLRPEDQARFDSHPAMARDLLANIPRLEPVAWMISQQMSSAAELSQAAREQPGDLVTGARILKVAVAYDRWLSQGTRREEVLAKLLARPHLFDPEIVKLMEDLEQPLAGSEVRSCQITELQPGMVLQEEVRTKAGMLIVAKGQEITVPLIVRLKNFAGSKAIPQIVSVLAPQPAALEKVGV